MAKASKGTPGAPRVVSIRWIVSGAALAMTAAAVVGVGAVAEHNSRIALTHELESRLVLAARNLAMTSSRALLSDFPELTLAPILSEMASTQPEQAFAAVVDLSDEVRGHANARLLGQRFRLPESLRPRDAVTRLSADERMFGDDSLLVAEAPVLHPAGHRIGTAYVGFRRAYVEQVVTDARRTQLLVVALALAAGVVAIPLMLSVLLRPVGALRAGLERIGRGDLQSPVHLRDRTEFGLLATAMNDMAQRIHEAQKESLERERLARELELAREIQASLLPHEGMQAGAFRLEGSHRAAAEVGGDFYDMFGLPGGKVGVVMADVSGKGLAGCLVTSMLAALVRAFRTQYRSPKEMLVRLDETLRDSLRPGTFVTMFYGVLDPADGTLEFASAGHVPLLLRRADGRIEWYRTTGIPIGAIRTNALARTLREDRVRLDPGDLAIQFTDGVNEAFDPSGEHEFGFDGLEKAVASGTVIPRDMVLRIKTTVDKWSAGSARMDDETLLVIGADASPGRGGQDVDPRRALEEARRHGTRLALPADIEALARLEEWLTACPGLQSLAPRLGRMLHTAIYELCANVIEHGYGLDGARSLELFWVPDDAAGTRGDGRFVLVDQGAPFQPGAGRVDFNDIEARKKGRGIGLEIIRTVMRPVTFHAVPGIGNVTILAFEPSVHTEEEVRHG